MHTKERLGMIRNLSTISLLCFILAMNAQAVSKSDAQSDYSEIEAIERQQIISDLSYRLQTQSKCDQTLIWDDGGSGANMDGYFFMPTVSKTEYIIGGYVIQKRRSSSSCVLTVSESKNNPEKTPPLLVKPKDWKLIWKDKGSGANRDGSIWQATSPGKNYKCIGSVPQLGYNKPNSPNYRCVHVSLTETLISKAIAWSDKGSGADKKVTMFRLPNSGSFTTIPARASNVETYDLKANPTNKPDPDEH